MSVARRLTVLLLALVLLTGCVRTIAGHPVAADGLAREPVDTSFIQGSDGSEIDQLAAATLLDLQAYWKAGLDDAGGEFWSGLAGGYHSVDTSAPRAGSPPPCVDRAAEVEGNAFYCPGADAIVWDRAALLPALTERFGDAAVAVVLAHEMGHAVHHELGLDLALQRQRPQTYPPVLTEAMADCYAGAFTRWVIDGHAEHLDVDRGALDLALGALVTFRDPVGTPAGATAAHGNGFDRVSAFQDGYEHGPPMCSAFSVSNREFTQEAFSSAADAASGGNLPLDRLISTIAPDLAGYFGRLVARHGGRWQPPPPRVTGEAPGCSGDQGPVAYCPGPGTIEIDTSGELPRWHARVGDYTAGLLLATRYALAALDELGRSVRGPVAARTALCLAGGYSGDLLNRSGDFGMSPGDLDEAVQLLLAADYGSRDAHGHSSATGFERVAAFRDGTRHGAAACGL